MAKTAEQTTDSLDDDLFAAGFDEALGGEGVDDPAAAMPNDAETAEAKAAEEAKAVEDAAKAEADAKAAEEAKAVEDAAKAEADAKAAEEASKAGAVDIHAIVAEAVAAATKPAKEEPAAAAGPTAEEIAAEEQFRKDWPEHAAREDRLKAELESVKTLLTTTVEALKGQIAPVIENAHQTETERHYNTIVAAHKDANEIYPEVKTWIAAQPKILQPQYTAVLKEGTATEVIELFDIFKAATGKQAADTTAADTAKAADEAAKKKADDERLARMRGVNTQRTSTSAEEDPDDFDSAFDQAASKLKLVA